MFVAQRQARNVYNVDNSRKTSAGGSNGYAEHRESFTAGISVHVARTLFRWLSAHDETPA